MEPKLRIVILTDPGSIYAPTLLMESLKSPELEIQGVFYRERKGGSKWQTLRRVARKSGWPYALSRMKGLLQMRLSERKLRAETGNSLGRNGFVGFDAFREFCEDRHVPIRPIENCNAPSFVDELKSLKTDILVSAFYSQIFKNELIAAPCWTCLNIHPSLLPQYRGTNPVYWALAEGQPRTGLTIHVIDQKVDTGDIVAQCETPIRPDDTHHALYLRLVKMGSVLLRDILKQAAQTRTLPSHAQPEGEWKTYPVPTRESFAAFRKHKRRFF